MTERIAGCEDHERFRFETAQLAGLAGAASSSPRHLFLQVKQHLYEAHDLLAGWTGREAQALDVQSGLHELAKACPDVNRRELDNILHALLPRVAGQSWGADERRVCERLARSYAAEDFSAWVAEAWLPQLSFADGALAVWAQRTAERIEPARCLGQEAVTAACRKFATHQLVSTLTSKSWGRIVLKGAEYLQEKHGRHIVALARIPEPEELPGCWTALVLWLLESVRQARRAPSSFLEASTSGSGFAPMLRPYLWWDPKTPWTTFSSRELLGQSALLPHQLRSNSLNYSPLGHALCERNLTERATLTWLRVAHAAGSTAHWWLPATGETHGCSHPHCTDSRNWLALRVQRLVSVPFLRRLKYNAIRVCAECRHYLPEESCQTHPGTKPSLLPEWPETSVPGDSADVAISSDLEVSSEVLRDAVQDWYQSTVRDLLEVFTRAQTPLRPSTGIFRKLTVLFALPRPSKPPPYMGLADDQVEPFMLAALDRASSQHVAAALEIEPWLKRLYEDRRHTVAPNWKPISEEHFRTCKGQLKKALRGAITKRREALESHELELDDDLG